MVQVRQGGGRNFKQQAWFADDGKDMQLNNMLSSPSGKLLSSSGTPYGGERLLLNHCFFCMFRVCGTVMPLEWSMCVGHNIHRKFVESPNFAARCCL